MDWQVVFNVLIAALTVGATVYGINAGTRGKNADRRQAALAAQAEREQADRSQRFAEITRSLEEARKDLTYYKEALAESRKEVAELDEKIDANNAEWRKRHLILLERCQEMSDVVKDLLDTSKNLSPDERRRMRVALGSVRRHIDHDHEQIDEEGHIDPAAPESRLP